MIQAVRLEAALYKDPEIAAFLKMTPAGLAQMKMDPEYDIMRMQVASGVASSAEEELLKDQEYKYEQLRNLVPQALTNLFDLARSQNEHIKLKATSEILDREGTIAKVSRIGFAMPEQGGVATTIDNEIASNLTNLLKIEAERHRKSQETAAKIMDSGSQTVQ